MPLRLAVYLLTNTYPGGSRAAGDRATPRLPGLGTARVCASRLLQWGPGEVFNPLLVATPISSLLLCPKQSRAAVPVAFPHAFSARLCGVPRCTPLGLPGDTSGVWALSTSRARAGLQGERSLAGACPPRAAFSSKPSRPPAFLIPPKRARSGEGTLRGQALWESRGPRVAPQVTQAAEARGWRAGRWQKGGKTSLPYS